MRQQQRQLLRQFLLLARRHGRHLRLLAESGLVTEERRGTRRIFRLHEQGLEAVQSYLERVWGEAAMRFTLLAENTAPPAPEEKPAR